MSIGGFLGSVEEGIGIVWSMGEALLAAARPGALRRDRARARVLADCRERGFYVPIDPGTLALRVDDRGVVEGPNPYRRVGSRANDRIRAHLSRREGSRHLVVVCHCYGIPSPRVMSALFGLDDLGVDVCTNIMGHHQPGTYVAWPGSGFVRVHTSTLLENLRASVTGVRALVSWLRDRYDYEQVTVVGFSIGGQLALHLANAGAVDRVVAYCPVAQLHVTVRELGLMRRVHGLVERFMRLLDPEFSSDDLSPADPLAYELAIDPEDLHVVVQRHDRLATPSQIEAIRARHPASRFYEFEGTHLYPAGLASVRAIVRAAALHHGAHRPTAPRGGPFDRR